MRGLSFWQLFVCVVVASVPYTLAQTATANFDLHTIFVSAVAGEEIRIPVGTFKLNKSLTITQNDISLVGAGKGKTILDFSDVKDGGQAVLIRASGVTVEGMSIINPPGDGLVARGVERVVLRDIAVRWVHRRPGGYGIYPVQCKNVTIEGVTVSEAIEAGIYVGQTSGALIRNSYVFNNVVGIDIENSSSVVVQDNISKNNSIGIAVTGRPFLFLKNPKYVSLVQNVIADNNLTNFAPEASFVKKLGSSVGLVLTAVRDVSVLGNVIENHRISDVKVIAYETLDPFFEGDPDFDYGFSGAKFRGNIFGSVSKLPALTVESGRALHSNMASTVTISSYDREHINADFACFDSSVDNAAFLALSDNFLSSTLPCDFNQKIWK